LLQQTPANPGSPGKWPLNRRDRLKNFQNFPGSVITWYKDHWRSRQMCSDCRRSGQPVCMFLNKCTSSAFTQQRIPIAFAASSGLLNRTVPYPAGRPASLFMSANITSPVTVGNYQDIAQISWYRTATKKHRRV